MTEDEFTELLKDRSAEPRVYTSDFDGADRTLLYGYTCDRLTWHVYLKDGQIHRLIYQGHEQRSYEAASSFLAYMLVPDKRAYPEATDLQMAQRLQSLGVAVEYVKFDVTRRDYYEERERDENTPFAAPLWEDFE